jgi:hypothetical protein
MTVLHRGTLATTTPILLNPNTPDVTHYVAYWSYRLQGRNLAGQDVYETKDALIAAIKSREVEGIDRIVAFNAHECWSRDVTEDIATDIADDCYGSSEPVAIEVLNFLESQLGVVGCRSLAVEA